MTYADLKERFAHMNDTLVGASPTNWEDITRVLSELKDSVVPSHKLTKVEFIQRAGVGTAFVTFDYGIDGVSIEIGKYAHSLASLYGNYGESKIHLIGGDFHRQADSVIDPDWHQYSIEGTNGWSKWDNGKWFAALNYQDMPPGSQSSYDIAVEIYTQAVSIAQQLGRYILENDISLLIPVNIASNPGNLSLTLAITLVSEAMGVDVINSNHDFYWDGGKPSADRTPGEPPGIRDHFFRNIDNQPYFTLFESLYPWNGRQWLQTNINKLQSQTLIERYAFPSTKVSELSTSVSNEFFLDYTREDVKLARLRMGYILSGGEPIMNPQPVEAFVQGLGYWMQNQTPSILSSRAGLRLDPTSDELLYLLQPTRVVARKRIERDIHLIQKLLSFEPFKGEFERVENRQIVLHITGPTPIEHQRDLERVLWGYVELLESLPSKVADRVFLAFSVGNEEHPSFQGNNFARLHIEDIYRMATVVVFPSEIEGRGLPIIESSACGVPILCSRYNPQEVFAEVVGENLPEDEQIQYTLFPEGNFSDKFLNEVSQLLLHPEIHKGRIKHNKDAVRSRYSVAALRGTFENLLDTLRVID
jgi:glycosyltransferase involved in cell wall biosynthesis